RILGYFDGMAFYSLDELNETIAQRVDDINMNMPRPDGLTRREGPDPRKVDTSGASYAAVVSIAEVSASKTSGARRLHQECRLRV
ncbi:hypothetical protein ACL1E9_13280, partial [Corynebacterium striatum]